MKRINLPNYIKNTLKKIKSNSKFNILKFEFDLLLQNLLEKDQIIDNLNKVVKIQKEKESVKDMLISRLQKKIDEMN